MEKYKGFLLQSGYDTYENSYFDGHRNCGDGTYTTKYFCRIIDSESAKSIKVDTLEEAKLVIDTWFSVEGGHRSEEIINSYRQKEEQLKELEKETNTKIAELQEFLHRERSALRLLYKGMPPKFY
jgi:Fic family protein